MSPGVLCAVGLLGAVGSVARFVVADAVSARVGGAFPWGTLAVNLIGTLALGVLVGAAVEGDALRLAGTGVLGSFTTFSTWAVESHRLTEDGRPGLCAANLAASLVLGLGVAWVGQQAGAAL